MDKIVESKNVGGGTVSGNVSLIERQTRIVSESESFAACLECNEGRAGARMLCEACYRAQRASDDLWKWPGDYMDDYTDEGQDDLDAFIHWLFSWNFPEFVDVFHEKFNSNLDSSLDSEKFGGELIFHPSKHDLGFGGYKWALGEDGCYECKRAFNIEGIPSSKHKGRGLCERCYRSLLKSDSLFLKQEYPTSKFVKNVKGHAWFSLRFHIDRVKDIANYYGIELRF